MIDKEDFKISKQMCYFLRHNPAEGKLIMDNYGFVDTAKLIEALRSKGFNVTHDKILEIVESDPCGRYSFGLSYGRIRANYGHSIHIDNNLVEVRPPKQLYHGTYLDVVGAILEYGIDKMERDYIHLTNLREKAVTNGVRRGLPVVLIVNTEAMYNDGEVFYMPGKCIWTTKGPIDPKYIEVE